MANVMEMSKEEVARRGKEIYEREIKDKVLPSHKGELILVDVLSGDYEINANPVRARQILRERHQNVLTFTMRIGYQTAYAMGGAMKEV